MTLSGTLPTRFWRYVDLAADCWLWTGAKTAGGYGSISIAHNRSIQATWASLLIHGRPTPRWGEVVMHSCDTPACVNPDHLTIGTQSANLLAASAKGRVPDRSLTTPRGELSPHAKIGWDTVQRIRDEAATHTVSDLSRTYALSRRQIVRIIVAQSWAAR